MRSILLGLIAELMLLYDALLIFGLTFKYVEFSWARVFYIIILLVISSIISVINEDGENGR